MAERFCFDTNVLFYSLDSSTGMKNATTLDVIKRANPSRSVILLRTLGELANAVSRRDSALLPSVTEFIESVAEISVANHPDDVSLALTEYRWHGMQFWDAAIWVSALRARCMVLFTEDYQNGRVVGGVKFCNPFVMSVAELDALLI